MNPLRRTVVVAKIQTRNLEWIGLDAGQLVGCPSRNKEMEDLDMIRSALVGNLLPLTTNQSQLDVTNLQGGRGSETINVHHSSLISCGGRDNPMGTNIQNLEVSVERTTFWMMKKSGSWTQVEPPSEDSSSSEDSDAKPRMDRS